MAFVSDNMQTLQILKRIIESTVFWEYITLNSKPYSAGYYALSGINIKNFCIPDFDEKAIMTLLSFNDKNDIDNFRYQMTFHSSIRRVAEEKLTPILQSLRGSAANGFA